MVKLEDGEGGGRGEEGRQDEASAGRAVQRRRVGEAGDAAWDEVRLLRLNVEAQAQAIQGMEQTRVLEARVAELAAEQTKLQSIIQAKDALLEAKDRENRLVLEAKDRENRLVLEGQRDQTSA